MTSTGITITMIHAPVANLVTAKMTITMNDIRAPKPLMPIFSFHFGS